MFPSIRWKQFAVAPVTRWNPWAWLTVFYGLQAMGALAVTHLFEIKLRQTALPIFVLVLGTVVSFVIGCLDSRTKNRIWKFWIPAFVYAVFITTMSHTSFPRTSVSYDTSLFHLPEYMALGVFFSWAWYPLMSHRSPVRFALVVIVTGTFFGIADELHQAFVPGRDSSFSDLVLDVIGLCAGVGLFMAARYVHKLMEPDSHDSP